MKKILKWSGIALGSLIVLVLIASIVIAMSVDGRLNKKYSIDLRPVILPTDPATLASGAHRASLCQECHGTDFAGSVIFDDPKLGSITAPNLTPGRGGIGSDYTNEDWVRSVRHGVKRDGTPLLVMPSEHFHHLGREELEALIVYLKRLPPSDRELKKSELTFLAKVLIGLGAFGKMIAAEEIDHTKGFDLVPPKEPTAPYGDYLVRVSGCRTCHGQDLNGGPVPNPHSPPSPNLTPNGNMKNWSPESFTLTMRTGKTPESQILNNEFMPWKIYGKMTDDELTAIFRYLQTLPGKETGTK